MGLLLRLYVTTGVALVGAGLITVTPIAPLPPGGQVRAEATLLDTEGFIIGGSGNPIPAEHEILHAMEHFNPTSPLFPGQPLFEVNAYHSLFTPEGFYPVTGIKSLPLNISIGQGLSIENTTIMNQIADGNNVLIGGGSQSAVISALEMRDLLALPVAEQPTTGQLTFILEGDEMNPNGGVLARFFDPNLPLRFGSLGITFYGAQPADTPWDTAVYTQEYDGYGDWPQYPLNLLSDLNAVAGIQFVHSDYTDISLEHMAETIQLPVSADYTGHTEYFITPTPDLPLLDPMRARGPLGNAFASLLQPDLKVLVNLGYGSIHDGWSQGPANVPTPFGLFPTNINPTDVLKALVDGAEQGIQAFTSDLSHLSQSSGSDAGSAVIGAGADMVASGTQAAGTSSTSFVDFLNTLSGALSHLYATLLPTADITSALAITLPMWDAGLFVQELTSGHLLDAIGMPIAAEFGITTVAGALEIPVYETAEGAVQTIVDAFRGLIAP